MRPLFPRWTNSALWLALSLLGLLVIGLPLALMVWVRTPYVTGRTASADQPVIFDHRHHVLDDGIDCLYCHYLAVDTPYAGVPPTELCLGCHGQIWNESPLLEPVRRSWDTGQPIHWRRNYRLPDFVYFHHAVHVNRGVGCVECHGHVEAMAQVSQVPAINMRWCLDCHRDPLPHLRPPELVTDFEWNPPDRLAIAADVQKRLGINPPTNCTACHR